MANRKKEINPIITTRVQELISGSDKSIRWICENVLNYASSNFNRFLKGEAQPPDYILDDLADYFGVRKEWLHGFDNYRTYNDIILQSRKILENADMNHLDSLSSADNIPQIYDPKLGFWRNMTVKEEAKYNCVINALTLCGYRFDEINNTDNFFEFMESSMASLKNSIELYMKTMNGKDGE